MDTKIQITSKRLGTFYKQVIDLFQPESPVEMLSHLKFVHLSVGILNTVISSSQNDKGNYDYDVDLYESELEVFKIKFLELLIGLNKEPMFDHSPGLSDEEIKEYQERLNTLIDEHFGREFKLNKLLSL